MRLCVFEDAGVVNLEPLSLTRPAFDLWLRPACCCPLASVYWVLRETVVSIRPDLASVCRQHHPDLRSNDPAAVCGSPCVFVNARWLPPTTRAFSAPPGAAAGVGMVGDRVAYVVLAEGERCQWSFEHTDWQLAEWSRILPNQDAGGFLLDYPWDLVERNASALEQDAVVWKAEQRKLLSREGLTILGPPEQVLIDAAARVDPYVLIDATADPCAGRSRGSRPVVQPAGRPLLHRTRHADPGRTDSWRQHRARVPGGRRVRGEHFARLQQQVP